MSLKRMLSWVYLASLAKSHDTFIGRAGFCADDQRQLLMSYLERNKRTLFGEAHDFGAIGSIADFQKRVPIRQYDQISPWIDQISMGKPGVLTAEPVLLLEPTSGTSAMGAKLIPYTAGLKREFQQAVGPWIYDLNRAYPGLRNGRSYWSVSPVNQRESRTSGGIPIGFEDDASYLGRIGGVVRAIFAVPSWVKLLSNIDDFRLATAYFLLRCRDLSLISVWNPSFLTLIVEHMEAGRETLLRAIHEGRLPLTHAGVERPYTDALSPDPRRARELERLWQSDRDDRYRQIWPGLQLISCWGDHMAAHHKEHLLRCFPGVAFQNKGLLATEGVISFPLECSGGHPLAYRSHFFEFIASPGDEPRLLHQLERGKSYRVIITTGGGLYRYDLKDHIEVTGHYRTLPLVRFVGRQQVSDLCGEKLDETFAREQTLTALRRLDIATEFIMMVPTLRENGGGYVLFVQLSDEKGRPLLRQLAALLEEGLQQNFHYRYARGLGQLHPLRVFHITTAGWQRYLLQCQENGQRLGDIKQVFLAKPGCWDEVFEGRFYDSR